MKVIFVCIPVDMGFLDSVALPRQCVLISSTSYHLFNFEILVLYLFSSRVRSQQVHLEHPRVASGAARCYFGTQIRGYWDASV